MKIQPSTINAKAPKIFATNDPYLTLALACVSKLPIMGTMHADDMASRHFVFNNTDKLQKHLTIWKKLEVNGTSNSETLSNYIYNKLESYLRQDFDQMVKEINDQNCK